MTEAYAGQPGFKTEGTSADAARAMTSTAKTVRLSILKIMEQSEGWTTDEMAGALGLNILTVRPRFSELAAEGRIKDSGARRENVSGHNAIVWVLAPPGTIRKKPYKMKPVGNPQLWGELMRAIYAHARTAIADPRKEQTRKKLNIAALVWSSDMALRVSTFENGIKPDWMTDTEWDEMQHISGAYGFHD